METLKGMKRTHYALDCLELEMGEEVTIAGFVARSRDLGNLIFTDLRDVTGIIQLAFDDTSSRELFEKARSLRSEYTLIARGLLRERSSKTDKIETGSIEVFCTELRILSGAQLTPFEIRDEVAVRDELSLAYRYLDLRRPSLTRNIVMRSKITKTVRDYFLENRFVEIETPTLIKSTPEGARDYIVPSRVQPGSFYALPQSPQLYKQLLMLSGFDRYFQIARCYRDEDLRADRQPEFTQIDVEMSFVDTDEILAVNEGLMERLFKDILGREISLPLPRMSWREAMERFGSDKPDTRFGLELCDISDIVKDGGFAVFENALKAGGSVRAIKAEGLAENLKRKEIDKLADWMKHNFHCKGLAWTRFTAEGRSSSYEKFLSEEARNAVDARLGFKEGDALFIVADEKDSVVFASLGGLRCELARRFGLIDPERFDLLWVVEFPLFEYSEEDERFVAKHHPFTMPMDEDIEKLQSDPASCRAKAYDIVLNGVELGGGSIRINDPALQERMFRALGFDEETLRSQFGFLIDAYKYGAPPHGGYALGLDRLCMLLLGLDNIRDVIAFPKVQNASELMSGCPSAVSQKQLDELGIAVLGEKSE
ncbi:MAG: aspartate--tRNA ligase [Oscillospiraceae bacterium]|nr:aspartate--tRNA ligase [Oscillospiraceae bacterium]